MTPEQIKEIRERCDKATPKDGELEFSVRHVMEFAKTARTDIPALLDYISELEGFVKYLEWTIEQSDLPRCKHCEKRKAKVCEHNACESCKCEHYCWID